jgi:4-hydroxybutyryl-CoA dehydratase/vinylacetyl-CoA-Delta-isomerase
MLTGQQYKDSLQDGRKVYFEGRLIEDFSAEPGLAVPMNVAAEGYDKYFSAEPGALNPVITAPRSAEDLREKIPELLEMDLLLNVTYQSIMTLIVAASRIATSAPQFIPRIEAYIEKARRDDIRITECITDAKGNRSLSPIKTVHYGARDGTPIEAVLTLPRRRSPKNLPLVDLPHGGPIARDSEGWDWWRNISRGPAMP